MINFSTPLIICNLILFIAGFYLLIKGSDLFVDASCQIAQLLHISKLVIGLTIVSIGTSIPELATNIYSSAIHESGIAIGNIIGSNIANICLVLALAGLITGKVLIKKDVLKRDIPIMTGSFIVLYVLCLTGNQFKFYSGKLTCVGGIILLVLFVIYMFHLICITITSKPEKDSKPDIIDRYKLIKNIIVFILGLIVIFAGSKLIIDNVIWFAHRYNISQTIIALTLIAFGTSVPELAVTITGAVKGQHSIAVGNIVGSCFINITLILGISALIYPLQIPGSIMLFSIPLMLLSGFFILIYGLKTNKVTRYSGLVLILFYLVFLTVNIVKLNF